MQALHFLDVGELAWRETPDLHVDGNLEAIVRPVASTTCDLDRWIITGLVSFGSDFPWGTSASPRWSRSATGSPRSRQWTSSSSPGTSRAGCAPPAAGVCPPRGSEQRRDVARALGADGYFEIVPDRDCWKYPVVIGVARETEMLAEAVRCLAPGGHLSNAAMFFADTPLPLWEMNKRDVTFSTGTASVKPHVPAVLELIRSGQSTPTGSGRRTTGRPPRRPCSNPISSP